MNENNVDLIHEIIANRPVDLLEVMALDADSHLEIQHIMARAALYRGIDSDYCQERKYVVTLSNLIKLQRYGFQVYLSQNRDLELSYERTISYICLLLNQNIPMKTILGFTPNQFMDEAQSYLPRRNSLVSTKIKTRGELSLHLWKNNPSIFQEAIMSTHLDTSDLRDIILQGQLFHWVNPDKCKDFDKVSKSSTLKKLQEYGKALYLVQKEENEEKIQSGLDVKPISYQETIRNIAFLLNHQILVARILLFTLEEFQDKVSELQEKDTLKMRRALERIQTPIEIHETPPFSQEEDEDYVF